MSSRPRPRPRPRVATSSESKTAQPTGASTSASQSTQQNGDDDALFMRNRNRTATKWKALETRVKKAEASSPTRGDLSESEDNASPRSKKQAGKNKGLPSWRQPGIVEALLLHSDDEDDEGVNGFEDSMPKAKGKGSPKGKRRRSRSRSITPPPPVSAHQVQIARNVVRQTLGVAPRAASPTWITDDDPGGNSIDIELDPELASIAAAVKKGGNSGIGARASHTGDSALGGDQTMVKIKVKWIPHPRDATAKCDVWEFEINRSSSFADLFESTADEAAVLTENLVVTYDGKRVFAGSTPLALNIWTEAELEACTKITYNFMRDNKYGRVLSPDTTGDDAGTMGATARSPSPVGDDNHLASGSEAESPEKVKITLRSGSAKNMAVTVKPTTLCSTILSRYLERIGKTAPKAWLAFEGDKLNPKMEIQETDLEDGDMVDVMGL